MSSTKLIQCVHYFFHCFHNKLGDKHYCVEEGNIYYLLSPLFYKELCNICYVVLTVLSHNYDQINKNSIYSEFFFTCMP